MTLASTTPTPPDGSQSVANRNKVMMLAATGSRMGVALFGFMIMARFLGPQHFGVIATAVAYSSFIGIVTDFGMGVCALRMAAAEPERSAEILTDAFATKLVLTVIGAVAGLASAVAFLPAASIRVYAMVFAGVLAYAFADLAMVAARVRGRFDTEAKVVVSMSVVILAVVGGTAAATRNLEATAAAFMLSRLAYLAATQILLKRAFGISIGWWRPLASIRNTIRLSVGYAVDAILTSISSQIDVLLFAALLTVHDIGVYQAGARLVQAIMPFAAVLSTIYLPTLSAAAIKGQLDVFHHSARRINIEFFVLSAAAGLGFKILGPIGTRVIYGDRYDALIPLWTGFGIFALLRLMAASYGIQLTAMGFIRTRIAAQVASMLVFVLALIVVMPHLGLALTSWLLALSGLPVLLVSGIALARSHHSDRSIVTTIILAITMSIILTLF
jgi:O-antigen/teichoic acid export membrane protein